MNPKVPAVALRILPVMDELLRIVRSLYEELGAGIVQYMCV